MKLPTIIIIVLLGLILLSCKTQQVHLTQEYLNNKTFSAGGLSFSHIKFLNNQRLVYHRGIKTPNTSGLYTFTYDPETQEQLIEVKNEAGQSILVLKVLTLDKIQLIKEKPLYGGDDSAIKTLENPKSFTLKEETVESTQAQDLKTLKQ